MSEVTEAEILPAAHTPELGSVVGVTETSQQSSGMLQMIERVVMSPDVAIDKLEQMLAMQERVWAREERKAFDRAIAEAKAEIPPIIKDGHVNFKSKDDKKPDTDYRHETLAGIARVVDPILSKYGLSYRYRSEMIESGQLRITCVVSHRDGYSEETALQGSRDDTGNKNNFQAMGSAATYLQRYTLKLALGLSAAVDNDASKLEAAGSKTIDADQFLRLRELMEEASADEDLLKKFLKHESEIEQLPVSKLGTAESMLKQKISNMKKEAE